MSHTIDLGGNTLTVNSALQAAWQVPSVSEGDCTATFTNGTLQLGTPGTPADLLLGHVHQATGNTSIGTVQFTTGTTFKPYIDTLQLGGKDEGVGHLDLRNVQIENDTLSVNTLGIAEDGFSGDLRQSYIRLDGASDVRSLEVKSSLTMATDSQTQARLGDADNGWKLPADVDVTLGVDTGNRASVTLGGESSSWANDAYLAASSGGTITAYISTLYAGRNPYNWSNTGLSKLQAGVLDFAAMDTCTVDATEIVLGTDDNGVTAGAATAPVKARSSCPTVRSPLAQSPSVSASTKTPSGFLNSTGPMLRLRPH